MLVNGVADMSAKAKPLSQRPNQRIRARVFNMNLNNLTNQRCWSWRADELFIRRDKIRPADVMRGLSVETLRAAASKVNVAKDTIARP